VSFSLDPDTLGLVDKVALVMGGGGPGIGGAHCLGFARAGCHVAVVDVDREGGLERVREVEALGRKAVFVEANLREPAGAERAVSAALQQLGRVDIAVNIVGGPGKAGTRPFLDITDEMWLDTLDLNLMTTVRCCRAEARAMIEQGTAGSIINIGSVITVIGAAYMTPYAAAKCGVVSLTKALAVEFGEHGIRVNCTMPGYVMNDRIRQVAADPNGHPGAKAMTQASIDAAPLHRGGETEEMAGLSVFFASRLGGFVTGQDLLSDGGISLTIARRWDVFKGIMTPSTA
jgi:NAD(P)-dependent dehydrogenase (short-subunit alcohol dehydrogenase family)